MKMLADSVSWCDGCYQRHLTGAGIGVPHPSCAAHLDNEAKGTELIPVGLRMPVNRIAWLTFQAPFVICSQGVAREPSARLRILTGTGVSVNEQDAVRAALHEVLERQSLYRMPADTVRYGTADQMPNAVPAQDTGCCWWVSATPLAPAASREPVWLPISWTQIGSARRSAQRTEVTDSTGAAVHRSTAEAARRGLLEWHERRSTLMLIGQVGPAAEPACIPADLTAYAASLSSGECTTDVIVSGDAVPTAIAVIRSSDDRAVGGAAAGPQAHTRAVAEAYGKAVAGQLLRGLAPAQAATATVTTGTMAMRLLRRLLPDTALQAGLRCWTAAATMPPDEAQYFAVDRSSSALARYGVTAVHIVRDRSLPVPKESEITDALRRLFA
jgi:YcaO cyclodehydratase, ATP-ad Mg2+-binding